MSTSAKTLTPEQQAALAKLQSFTQQTALDDYLSSRATQYGTTPKGAKSDTGWTAGETFDNPFAGLKQEQEYAVIGEGKRYTPRLQYDEYGGAKQGYIDSEGKFVEGALPEGLMKGMEIPAGDYDASEYYYEPIRSDKLTDVGVDWKGALGKTFSEQLGHKSTFTKAYRLNEKGNPVEINDLSLADIQSGKVIFMVGGKTGGTKRERMAQAYLPQGDKLIPVGDPKYYKGEHPDAKNVANALKIAAIASLPFGGIGGLLSGVTGTAGVGGLAGAALGELGINTAGSGLAGTLASAGLPSFAADAAAKALVSGVVSGGLGKLTDQPFSKGFKTGATSSLASDVIGAGVNKVAPDMFKGLGSLEVPTKSLATSALTAKALGRPFDIGQAVKGAAINYGLNQAGQAAGIDPKQQAAVMKFLNFAAPMIAARRKPGG